VSGSSLPGGMHPLPRFRPPGLGSALRIEGVGL
jgi:hypothetical protein